MRQSDSLADGYTWVIDGTWHMADGPSTAIVSMGWRPVSSVIDMCHRRQPMDMTHDAVDGTWHMAVCHVADGTWAIDNMALIASDCDAMLIHEHQMALIAAYWPNNRPTAS